MSMPGMMDTILNLGLNEASLKGLIKQTGNERFAYDTYRRFIQLFGKIALNISDEHFDERMAAIKRKYGAPQDLDLNVDHLKELAGEFLAIVQRHTGKPFPQDPYEQLEISIGAVFGSWMGKRGGLSQAVQDHRVGSGQRHGGESCTMVFGNMGTIPAPASASRATPAPARTHLWRISGQCAGRGCGGGYPHTKGYRRDGKGNAGDLPSVDDTA